MRVRVVVALLLVLVAAGTFNYLRPIPAVSPAHLLRTSDVVPGTPPGLPWPARGSAAVGVSGLGFLASSSNAQAIPAASVTKVMTALVILADKPLKSNESGPTVTLTEADVQSYQADLAGGQSVVKVEAGEQLSELQLLQGMLIPSANNYAESAARWDAGSLGAFVARMNDRASKLKLAHTKFADVSGASPASVSTPADLLALGMEAMRDPVFAGIVAAPQADLPVAGTVYNEGDDRRPRDRDLRMRHGPAVACDRIRQCEEADRGHIAGPARPEDPLAERGGGHIHDAVGGTVGPGLRR